MSIEILIYVLIGMAIGAAVMFWSCPRVIDLGKAIRNREHKFGESDSYFLCDVIRNGERLPALFTREQVNTALARADRNPEDT
ncbi:MAG: hypothetical protein LBE24_04080 [Methylobacillus sp.]|jgi:hypothetical protein|nr:hypothetical protein [Methylobacillus sp.]